MPGSRYQSLYLEPVHYEESTGTRTSSSDTPRPSLAESRINPPVTMRYSDSSPPPNPPNESSSVDFSIRPAPTSEEHGVVVVYDDPPMPPAARTEINRRQVMRYMNIMVENSLFDRPLTMAARDGNPSVLRHKLASNDFVPERTTTFKKFFQKNGNTE